MSDIHEIINDSIDATACISEADKELLGTWVLEVAKAFEGNEAAVQIGKVIVKLLDDKTIGGMIENSSAIASMAKWWVEKPAEEKEENKEALAHILALIIAAIPPENAAQLVDFLCEYALKLLRSRKFKALVADLASETVVHLDERWDFGEIKLDN
jgi:hypothetical protein